jgi:cyclopropane-fatty-acyl-phospholipid synthase
VAHHYDIDPRIYELFLDQDLQYSCAYYTRGADLERAQLLKKRHIAAKLGIEPGQRVLDIGSGWGGLALYLATTCGADVLGVTLSEEQLKQARTRAAKLGLAKSVRFDLQDYRKVEGRFNRIVSVGMFEHVGVPHYAAFFSAIHRLLEDDGVALLHTIGRSDRPTATNPFIANYIFPGGYIPALSEVMSVIERSGLICLDVEVLRLHYAETLRAWRTRFLENRARAVEIAGEEFARMWEFYLAGSEASFRHQGLVVFQIQLAKRTNARPITRDYMLDAERSLAVREGGRLERPHLAGE